MMDQDINHDRLERRLADEQASLLNTQASEMRRCLRGIEQNNVQFVGDSPDSDYHNSASSNYPYRDGTLFIRCTALACTDIVQ